MINYFDRTLLELARELIHTLKRNLKLDRVSDDVVERRAMFGNG